MLQISLLHRTALFKLGQPTMFSALYSQQIRMISRQTRLNRRLRQYRADRIQRESSASAFNQKDDGQATRQILFKTAKEYDL